MYTIAFSLIACGCTFNCCAIAFLILDKRKRDLQKKILDGTLGQFPLLSDSLKLHSLNGSPAALAIGVIGALLAGYGIMSATHNAMDRIWAKW